MLNMLVDFSVTYVRNIADDPAMWSADMEYLRSRMSINRSLTSERLTTVDNRVYEGAKTLIDMLDYLRLIRLKFILNEVHLEIDSDSDFPRAMITATLRLFNEDNVPLGPVTIYFIYTMVGQKNVNGAFITSIRASSGEHPPYKAGVGDMVIRDYFGNVPVLDKYVDLDMPYCYKASPSLYYSRNLPTPSEYVNLLELALIGARNYLDPKSNPPVNPSETKEELNPCL